MSLTPQSLTSRSRGISDSAVDDINEWYRGDWLRVSLTPKSPRNNLEPLHKNVLTHESWAQFSYIHEKQCWKFHDTIPLNWRRKKLSRIIYCTTYLTPWCCWPQGDFCTRKYLREIETLCEKKFSVRNWTLLILYQRKSRNMLRIGGENPPNCRRKNARRQTVLAS